MPPESERPTTNQGWVYRDVVDRSGAGSALLDFYASRYTHSTREQWRQRIVGGQIRVDTRTVDQPECLLTAGQALSYERSPWVEAEVPRDVTVVFEDEDLLIVDKPGGLPVVPGGDYLEHTLLWLLRSRYGGELSPLHRLGRGTSGLIAFARSMVAKREVSADFASGRVDKVYRALVSGAPQADRMTVTAPIGRVPYPPLGEVFAVVDTAAPASKASRSDVRVLERRRGGEEALVEVRIPTGRPHQIRIHMAAAGHPLVGESLYAAGGRPRTFTDQERPALPGDGGYHLHSTRMCLRHPGNAACVVALWSLPPAILRTRAEQEAAVGAHSS